MTKIEIISSDCGDWEALYINNKLVAEGHTIRVGDVLHAVQEVFSHTFDCSFITDERAEEGFPEDRNELVDYIVD